MGYERERFLRRMNSDVVETLDTAKATKKDTTEILAKSDEHREEAAIQYEDSKLRQEDLKARQEDLKALGVENLELTALQHEESMEQTGVVANLVAKLDAKMHAIQVERQANSEH